MTEQKPERETSTALVQQLRDLCLSRLVAINGPTFAVGVFMFSASPVEPAYAHTLGPAITHMPQGNNPDHFFKGGYQVSTVKPREAMKADFFPT